MATLLVQMRNVGLEEGQEQAPKWHSKLGAELEGSWCPGPITPCLTQILPRGWCLTHSTVDWVNQYQKNSWKYGRTQSKKGKTLTLGPQVKEAAQTGDKVNDISCNALRNQN